MGDKGPFLEIWIGSMSCIEMVCNGMYLDKLLCLEKPKDLHLIREAMRDTSTIELKKTREHTL